MTNSNGNFDKLDVLPEPIGRFTGTVSHLSVTVDHFTETVEHGFAELKVASREPSVNISQLIALGQSQTAALPKFCSFLFRCPAGAQLASAFKAEGAAQC